LVWATVGVHPHPGGCAPDDVRRSNWRNIAVVAIGECGLLPPAQQGHARVRRGYGQLGNETTTVVRAVLDAASDKQAQIFEQ
jgi:Tat protein secretion system quality control protein TatD with DNase activity